MARRALGYWLLLGLLCGTLPGAGGQVSPSRAVPPAELGYSVRLWTVEDGLPANFIDFLAQTPDGYLWWPTAWGVGRFDGVRFESFPIPDEDGRTQHMNGVCCDSRGRLWMWNSRRTIGTIEDGNYVRHGQCSGRPGFFGLSQSSDGRIWMSQQEADGARILECIDGGKPERRTVPAAPGSITQCHLDADGTLWLWDTGRLYRAEGDEAVAVPLPLREGQPAPLASLFFRLPQDEVAVARRDGIYELVQGTWKLNRAFQAPLPDGIEPRQAATDQLGNIWIGTRASGVWVATEDGKVVEVALPELTYPDGFGIGAVFADRENNIWIGTRSGLYQLQRAPFRRVLQSEPLARSEPVDLAEDRDGGFWVLTESGKPLRYSPSGAYLETLEGLPRIHFIEADAFGPVWLASHDQVWRWDQGELVPLQILDGDGGENPYFVGMKAVAGTLWGFSGNGLFRAINDQFVPQTFAIQGRDPGLVWFHGNAQGDAAALVEAVGLVRCQQARWDTPPTISAMPVQKVFGMHVDTDTRVWTFGNNPPLMRQQGDHWEGISLGDSEMPISILALESDDQGMLWGLTSEHGVFRLDPASPGEPADAVHWFRSANGLPSNAGRGWGKGMMKSRDGRIWVATARGVAVIDPAQWETEKQAIGVPQVHVEEVQLDDVVLPRESDGGVVVPPGRNRLAIRFTALGLNNASANRFKYQLSGVDADLLDSGTAREAVYHKLPPGRHRFQVIAANSFGGWNLEGATLTVTVLPFWWQTLWFRGGLAALLLGSLGLIRHVQLTQLRRKQARQEEFARQLIEIQETERKRLAGELHDDLGQDLLVIKSRLDTNRLDAEAGGQRGLIRELAGSVGSLIRKVREISHTLRPLQLERLGLSSCMRSKVAEVSEATGIPIETDIEDLQDRLSPTIEIGLYRILQEALNNVVKHSDASEVRVALKRHADQVILSVQDDGRGFLVKEPEETGEAMGHGLAGMAERCRLMGGRWQVRSAPGQGTLIRIEIPVREMAVSSKSPGRTTYP